METWHSAIVRSQNCSHFCHWTRFLILLSCFFPPSSGILCRLRIELIIISITVPHWTFVFDGQESRAQCKLRDTSEDQFSHFTTCFQHHNINWSRFTLAKIKIKRRTGRHALSQFIIHLNKLLPEHMTFNEFSITSLNSSFCAGEQKIGSKAPTPLRTWTQQFPVAKFRSALYSTKG